MTPVLAGTGSSTLHMVPLRSSMGVAGKERTEVVWVSDGGRSHADGRLADLECLQTTLFPVLGPPGVS